MKNNGKARAAGQVRSLTRALNLLRHLAQSGDGMSLTELSEAAELPPSTTHRLLTTLESERFVRPDPAGGVWQIGVAAFIVGTAFARTRDKLSLSRPYLRRVMEMSGETANLFVESDSEAVCIGQIESRHAQCARSPVSAGTGAAALLGRRQGAAGAYGAGPPSAADIDHGAAARNPAHDHRPGAAGGGAR